MTIKTIMSAVLVVAAVPAAAPQGTACDRLRDQERAVESTAAPAPIAAPAIDAEGNETTDTDAGDKRQMVATISSVLSLVAALKLTIHSNKIARKGA